MKISKIKIKKFKSFKDVIINFNKDINIFTGVNNAGKTAVLEAISLWHECFNKLIKRAQKNDKNREILKGYYKLGDKTHNYEDYREIISVRSPSFEDIFYNLDISNDIVLEATIKNDKNEEIDIGFQIKSASGSNYDIILTNYDSFDYKKFNEFFIQFPNPINITYASPISSLLSTEDFETLPKIRSRVTSRESIFVLRNRLYQLRKDSNKYNEFITDISNVISNDKEMINFNIDGDEIDDVKLTVRCQIGGKDTSKDISLLGSGTLQIIEILLSCYEKNSDLNIILLDEPDSHIHRDIQKRLLNILIKHSKNTQIFITTHNESLIRSSSERHLFYLEKGATKEYNPIFNEKTEGIKKGLQPSRQIKILQSLGSETALDILNALESDKLILVEGQDDAKYIQAILDKKYIDHEFNNIMYWAFDGIDNLLPKIKYYKEFFSLIKNGESLWEKCILVFDSDYITTNQKEQLETKFQSTLGIKTYIWNSYTIESSVLTDMDKFNSVLVKMLEEDGKIQIDKEKVITFVNYLRDDLIRKYKGLLDKELNERIASCIQNRRNNMNKIELNFTKDIFDTDLYLLDKYKKYATESLNKKDISILANKKDFELIIREVYKNFKIALEDDVNCFTKFINAVDRSLWFDEWDNLIMKIRV